MGRTRILEGQEGSITWRCWESVESAHGEFGQMREAYVSPRTPLEKWPLQRSSITPGVLFQFLAQPGGHCVDPLCTSPVPIALSLPLARCFHSWALPSSSRPQVLALGFFLFSCHSLGHISPLCRCSVSWSAAFWKNCSWIVHRGKLLFPCILVFHLTLFIVFIDQNFLRTVTCLWSTGQLDHQACYVLPALLMRSVLVDLTNCRCKIFRKNWV